ncbi:hypothetical protein [Streptacidiphilus rugosus]|uniref:hypothetical protein n=1 Tax=Streptacidiphilus rugosus TaxID=405783 RepID=UPI00055F28BC|nr:hypothetical protein [Streptacidiphilus rugosus]
MRLTTGQAAGELGVTGAPLRKLVQTGLVPGVLNRPRGQVFPLEALQALKTAPHTDLSLLPVAQLAVLRIGPAMPVVGDEGEDRAWLGFGTQLTPHEILHASNRWWRCDPSRVAEGRVLPVTVCGFVVAVLVDLNDWVDNGEPATLRRFHFTGARLAGYVTDLTSPEGHVLLPGVDAEDQKLAAQLLGSRLPSQSGGPIAYVPAGPAVVHEGVS